MITCHYELDVLRVSIYAVAFLIDVVRFTFICLQDFLVLSKSHVYFCIYEYNALFAF